MLSAIVCVIAISCICSTLGAPVGNIPGVVTSEAFNQSLVLDPAGDYLLYWNFNETDITFEVHVRTKGWVGFGISSNGNMFPADVITGWVTSDGHAHFSDRHTVGHLMPTIDKHQDWYLLMAKENEFGTVLKFTRKIITCDTAEDEVIQIGTVRLIYAFSPTDPTSDDTIMYHGTTRGTKSVSLLSENRAPPDMPSDVTYFDFLNGNFSVPDSDTTYLCKGFQMPDIGKHHMIKYEAIITPGNEANLHHVILYRCHADPSSDGAQGACYDYAKRPKNLPQCANILLVWAIGSEPFYFPDDAGISIGGPDDITFFVMETHYDNPLRRADIIDNSGIRISLTKILRPQEAGTFEIGVSVVPQQVIPPYQKAFLSSGYCYEQCVREGFQRSNISEIKMFAGFQHSHLIGAAIRTRHYRNGTELKPLLEEPNYDFDFQQARNLPKEVSAYPGDSFSVECTYDSTDRHGPTFGGLSTLNEMCLSVMYYYPKWSVEACISNPIYDTYQPQGFDKDLYKKFVSSDWTNKTILDEFITNTKTSKVRHDCFGANNMWLHETFVEKETASPYIPPPPKCG